MPSSPFLLLRASLTSAAALCLAAPAPAAIGVGVGVGVGACTDCSASTEHQYSRSDRGRGGVEVLAKQSATSPAQAAVSGDSVLGSTAASASVGVLKGRSRLDRSAAGLEAFSGQTMLWTKASFSDTLSFNFGDTAVHNLRVALPVDGFASGPNGERPAFRLEVMLAGDFAHRTGPQYETTLYNMKDGVQSPGGGSISFCCNSVQSALIADYSFTGAGDFASTLAHDFRVRSGASYGITVTLTFQTLWEGAPFQADLSHTVTVAPFTGVGLRGVNSAAQGLLSADAGGGFGYGAAAPVPEPASWAALLGGLALVAAVTRQRRRADQVATRRSAR